MRTSSVAQARAPFSNLPDANCKPHRLPFLSLFSRTYFVLILALVRRDKNSNEAEAS